MFECSGLNARARGLATHLLARDELERLAQAADLARLAAALEAAGCDVRPAEASVGALDLAVRRRAARQMRTLALWCGSRHEALAIVFEEEDRRSLRAIVRGAVQGATAEARLAACIPTPALPERALGELARQTTAGAVAALLVAWGNPYGGAILAEARRQNPDLFLLEVAISRAFFARALRCSRGRALTDYVRETIDVENAVAALVLATQPNDVAAAQCFVAGGRRLGRSTFEAAASAGDREASVRKLARAFAGSPFSKVFASDADSAMEVSLLAAAIRKQARAAIRDPLGPAPLLEYTLRLRAEAVDLRRIVWGTAFGVPAQTVSGGLVSI
jgi:vacuolar-type H+-ATPase subunit C/Vma6